MNNIFLSGLTSRSPSVGEFALGQDTHLVGQIDPGQGLPGDNSVTMKFKGDCLKTKLYILNEKMCFGSFRFKMFISRENGEFITFGYA